MSASKEAEYIGTAPPNPASVETAVLTFFAYAKLNFGNFSSIADPLREWPDYSSPSESKEPVAFPKTLESTFFA